MPISASLCMSSVSRWSRDGCSICVLLVGVRLHRDDVAPPQSRQEEPPAVGVVGPVVLLTPTWHQSPTCSPRQTQTFSAISSFSHSSAVSRRSRERRRSSNSSHVSVSSGSDLERNSVFSVIPSFAILSETNDDDTFCLSNISCRSMAQDAATQTEAEVPCAEVATQTDTQLLDVASRASSPKRPPLLPSTLKLEQPRPESPQQDRSKLAPRSSICPAGIPYDLALDDCNLGFDGSWTLRQPGADVAPFLQRLHISRTSVIDGTGSPCCLQISQTGGVLFEGGSLSLANNMLVRLGKSGSRLVYVRERDALASTNSSSHLLQATRECSEDQGQTSTVGSDP